MKRPIVANFTEIGIIEKHNNGQIDDRQSFDDEEVDPHPYTRVLMISLPIARVTIHKILANTRSAINILYINMLKWIVIPLYIFLL